MDYRNKLKEQKLIFASIAFLILFNFPFLSIADTEALVCGIPVLYVFMFAIWLIFIFVIGLYLYYERRAYLKNHKAE